MVKCLKKSKIKTETLYYSLFTIYTDTGQNLVLTVLCMALTKVEESQRWGFRTIHGAEESSGVNSSPAGPAGQVVGKT